MYENNTNSIINKVNLRKYIVLLKKKKVRKQRRVH